MQCAKPLLILSVTLAAKNDIQTPAVDGLNKASFSYGSTLGLQRSRKLTQSLVDAVQLNQPKDNAVTEAGSSFTAVGQRGSPLLGLQDVSVLGLQRSFTVTKRAHPHPEETKTTVLEDDHEHAAPQPGLQISGGNPEQATPRLEDVSVLGLQRSFTVTKRPSPSDQIAKAEDSLFGLQRSTKLTPKAAPPSEDPEVEPINPVLSTPELDDVSGFGLQRSLTVTKRASLPNQNSKAEDLLFGLQRSTKLTPNAAPPIEDSEVEPINPMRSTPDLDDVSGFGLQRSFTVTKRASIPKQDSKGEDSLFGLQRSATLTPKVAPPTEDPDVEPNKGTNAISSSADSSIAGASLLGRQQWTHLSRGQEWPTEDTDDAQDQEVDGAGNSNISLLGLQSSWKLSQRPAVTDDTENSELVQGLHAFAEMDLRFEDVSVLGLQRSVQFQTRASDPTSNSSSKAVLGLQRSKTLTRGQAAPIEEEIDSMVMEV